MLVHEKMENHSSRLIAGTPPVWDPASIQLNPTTYRFNKNNPTWWVMVVIFSTWAMNQPLPENVWEQKRLQKMVDLFFWLSTAVTGEWRGKSFKATGMQLTMISIILLFIFPINRTVVKSNIQEGYAVSSKYLHAALKAFSEMKLKFYGKLSFKLSK